jgi:hypothetical protein
MVAGDMVVIEALLVTPPTEPGTVASLADDAIVLLIGPDVVPPIAPDVAVPGPTGLGVIAGIAGIVKPPIPGVVIPPRLMFVVKLVGTLTTGIM